MSKREARGGRVLAVVAVVAAAAIVGAWGVSGVAQPRAQTRPAAPIYKDASQPVEARVEDLLQRMTLEEKAAQLITLWEQKAKIQTEAGRFDPAEASRNFPNGIGQIARPSDKRGVTQSNAGAAGASAGAVNREARDTA